MTGVDWYSNLVIVASIGSRISLLHRSGCCTRATSHLKMLILDAFWSLRLKLMKNWWSYKWPMRVSSQIHPFLHRVERGCRKSRRKHAYARFLPKFTNSFLFCSPISLEVISEGCGWVHLVTIPEPILRLIGVPGDLQLKEIPFAQMRNYWNLLVWHTCRLRRPVK